MTETARPVVFRTEIPPDTEQDAESGAKPPSVLRLLLSWRNWNIPTKLTAVTLVPVVFAIVLGAMQIADQVGQAESYRQVDRLVAVNAQLRPLVGALQQERTATTAMLAAGPVNPAMLNKELADERQSVDVARTALMRAAHRARFHNEITSARFDEVTARLDELAGLRNTAAAAGIDAPVTLARYSMIIGALLNFDRAAAAEVIDPALAGTAVALHDLQMATEEARYQQALVGIGLARGGLTDVERAELHASMGRLDDRTADFRLDANPAQQQEYGRLVTGSGVQNREQLAKTAGETPPGTRLPVDASDWNLSSEYTAGRTAAMATTLGNQIGERSARLQDQASTGAGVASVILLIALIVAGVVMFAIGRHLLRSLNVLRHSALDVAEHALPRAVERIRDAGEHAKPVLRPVPVTSTDEVGQVARAFEAVHRQALRLATEQAGLRARYSDVFVNLSRRSQGLVQRQLQLLERLERDEEDAEQLATLFQLDHLATRMRRNNENLMVLSGSELGRRNQRPATLADLLRAAVSEIEQFERVVMLPPTPVLIVGYAVGDLVRLVAELLDNATAFSAPSTQVTIASHSFEDGSVCIAVLDEGIGMTEAELAAANQKLSNAHTVDVSTSRRMGLFVVGRLASRHGVEVSLHGGKDIPGVRATVNVPADLVTVNAAEAQTAALPQVPTNGNGNGHGPTNGSANGFAHDFLPSPLPRREKPANGASTSDIARRLRGDPPAPPASEPGPALEPEPAPEPAPPVADEPDVAETTAVEKRLPLPRRSPGASTFVKPVDTAAGPVDLALPGEQRPAGDSLFLPSGSEWWGTVPNGRSVVEETTPIFDEMVSAWFRSISDPPREGQEERWEFASDAGFLTARAVSESRPESFTENGLPRRNPKQNLVPGSAGEVAPAPGLDRDELRKRLNNYQRGVTRARDQRQIAEEKPGPPTVDLSGAGYRFAPGLTAGGLPRRPARESAEPEPNPDRTVDSDRAAELRGRLGNFQRGLSRGRRSLAELAERARDLGEEITAGAQPVQPNKRESE